MGAYRTGKSFLLDLFLRFLKFEADFPELAEEDAQKSLSAVRGGEEEFPMPAWLSQAGNNLEGAVDEDDEGFRFKGGMDHCTEGIWMWSEPFMRNIQGKTTAVLLMDTQGAWGGEMAKEQSAAVFGLTAVISSKQIYNINQQIQEDKVENLAYFMRFAQAAIRKAAAEMERGNNKLKSEEIEKPFQSLDFLVRDWRNFRDDWTVQQCVDQMGQHFARHVNPEKLVESSTAEALHSMFSRLKCFCMPHPGFAIEKDTWTGKVTDIQRDFIRFADLYVREVFSTDLHPKTILGSELSTMSFPMVLRDFVTAFHDAAPAAMSFTQAMQNCTVLLAKEQAMKHYTKKMDEEAKKNPRGITSESFDQMDTSLKSAIQAEFDSVTIFGPDETRTSCWQEISESLSALHARYVEENNRRLEKALLIFAPLCLVALSLFVLDRISDWTCDWWSQTCHEASKVMLLAYMAIACYVGVNAYLVLNDRGRLAAAMAGGELWKEMVRLVGVYGGLLQEMNWQEILASLKQAAGMAEGGPQSKKKD